MDTRTIQYHTETLWAIGNEADEFEREARLLLALKYYETGKLSTGLASQLTGVPRTTFLFLLVQYGLSLFGETADQLEVNSTTAKEAN